MTSSGPAGKARRKATFETGRWAEWIAAVYLISKGYRILERRYVVHGGEIDIVARRGRVIAFVEVKARPGYDEALSAVTAQKRRRLEKAATAWLSRHPWATDHVLRGDALLIFRRRWPAHVPNAYPLRIG